MEEARDRASEPYGGGGGSWSSVNVAAMEEARDRASELGTKHRPDQTTTAAMEEARDRASGHAAATPRGQPAMEEARDRASEHRQEKISGENVGRPPQWRRPEIGPRRGLYNDWKAGTVGRRRRRDPSEQ